MSRSGRFESRVSQRVCVGILSVVLHIGLIFIIIFSGRQHEGPGSADSPAIQLVLIEATPADRRKGVESSPIEPAVRLAQAADQLQAALMEPTLSIEMTPSEPEPAEFASTEAAVAAAEPLAIDNAEAPVLAAIAPAPTTVTQPISQAELASLTQRVTRIAEESLTKPRTEVLWEQDGKRYSAVLVRERANDGTALERVHAEISAAEGGKRLTTHITLKRLAFSQFTQMVDRWDPLVQLHADEIGGRFHTNTRFNILYDSQAAPKFLGKVTTAARNFHTESSGRRRDSEVFRGGVETRAGRIGLPQELQPSNWAPAHENARIHEFANDTRISFFSDGSYSWRTRGSTEAHYINEPSKQPVYFIAADDVSLYVKGVVAGKILIYSPQRIVIEGNLTYAHDPRATPGSSDYLGLVCDRYVEIARPSVTGPGDVEVHGAIFAGRRFVITDAEHRRKATLRIFGSLSAGTISASEPRYATKIDHDERFERVRPPGFPSTNRHEIDDWNEQWTEAAEPLAD